MGLHPVDKQNIAVKEGREFLTKFIELYGKPAVRNDPVIRAMLKGISPVSNPFETASMAVATLRNAGCLDPDKDPSTVKQTVSVGKQKDKEKEKKEKTPKEKPPALRGFARQIDVLLEDAVYRGDYPDKEAHPVAVELRRLRKDPNRELEVVRFKGNYEEVTYPNGKTGKVLVGLEVDSKGVPLKEEAVVASVKDLSDFDLLALESEPTLALIKDEVKTKLFSWAETDSADPMDKPENFWPSLKGTETLKLIAEGKVTKKLLDQALNAENFARYGPSPTLYFPESGNYNARTKRKLRSAEKPPSNSSPSSGAVTSGSGKTSPKIEDDQQQGGKTHPRKSMS